MPTTLRMMLPCFVLVLSSLAQSAVGQQYATRSRPVARSAADYLVSRPTVSPYLNLLRAESDITMPNYHTLVRPAIESRQQSAEQSTEIRRLQSNVTNMQGKLAGKNRGSQFSTGHPTRFMSYLHYYPSISER
jgi:hypothetical protein